MSSCTRFFKFMIINEIDNGNMPGNQKFCDIIAITYNLLKAEKIFKPLIVDEATCEGSKPLLFHANFTAEHPLFSPPFSASIGEVLVVIATHIRTSIDHNHRLRLSIVVDFPAIRRITIASLGLSNQYSAIYNLETVQFCLLHPTVKMKLEDYNFIAKTWSKRTHFALISQSASFDDNSTRLKRRLSYFK